MKVYHYRSIESALSEIKCGTFRFSGPKELNDPLEGYIEFYWQGDRTTWEGLFKNYVCSLYNCLNLWLMGMSKEKVLKNVVIDDIHYMKDKKAARIYKIIGERFIQQEVVQECIKMLINEYSGEVKCTSRSLSLWMTLMNFLAYNICVYSLHEANPLALKELEPIDGDALNSASDIFKEIDQEWTEDQLQWFLNDLNDTIKAREIIKYQETKDLDKDRKELLDILSSDFGSIYVDQLKDIIYPRGLVVCFSERSDNSVMWGNYADKHRGVCLIYDLALNAQKDTIELISNINGYPIVACAGSVEYEDRHLQMNFFTPLERYDFKKRYFVKMKEWKYEKEYRLLIGDTFVNYDEERFLRYSSNALKGVIFGIKTSKEDIYAILEALHETIPDLASAKLYFAIYDELARSIRIKETHLLERFLQNADNFNLNS